MSNRAAINTDNAPAAIGPYSQAIKAGNTIYLSGQIPLDPVTGELIHTEFAAQTRQVFKNLSHVCQAANGTLADIVKLTLYLTDLANFPEVNAIMKEFFSEPFPARTAIEVSALPRASRLEADAIMVIGD